MGGWVLLGWFEKKKNEKKIVAEGGYCRMGGEERKRA